MIMVSSQGILSVVFQFDGANATVEDVLLAAWISNRFEQETSFREAFLAAFLNVSQVVQPHREPPPRLDVRRTLADVRRELGIASASVVLS